MLVWEKEGERKMDWAKINSHEYEHEWSTTEYENGYIRSLVNKVVNAGLQVNEMGAGLVDVTFQLKTIIKRNNTETKGKGKIGDK